MQREGEEEESGFFAPTPFRGRRGGFELSGWQLFMTLALSGAVTGRLGAEDDPGARELLREVIASASADDESVSIRMELTDSDDQVRQRTATLYSKRDGEGNVMRLIRFHTPADLAKSGILVLDKGAEDAEQWLYLPAYHTSRRVAAANRSDTWMGTDFAYEDMSDPNVDRYDYRYLENERVDGVECRVIEAVPREDTLKKESGYSRTNYWIDPRRRIAVKVDFYDKEGALVKQLRHSRLETHGSHYRWGEWRMHDVKRSHHTTLKFEDRKINQGLEERLFTVRFLERGR